MDEQRPNPDELLEKLQREEARAARGRLKVFFGACAGVGKTYAMLSAAQGLRAQGGEVVVGVAETHGRSETARLLEGLEALPPRTVDYRGRRLTELDLDGALARHPRLILVDELAHSNLVGSRHPKRWQDVEELLAAGIDVYTTMNVQHLESLNDIVGHITGIRVRETLPDHVFDEADEIVLVDLPPDELLQRLKEGKVYLPDQAQTAIQNFFRKGNLIALREIALRRTADRVDAQMRDYRADQAIQQVWAARERILVCVGPNEGGEQLVRAASRLAASLKADWLAIYVETPALQRLGAARRDAVLATLRLAQELGASTSTLAADDLASSIVAYARSRNVSKLVIGRSRRRALSRLFDPPLPDRLSGLAGDLDVYVVSRPVESPPPNASPGKPAGLLLETPRDTAWPGYGWAVAICALVSLVAAAAQVVVDLENVIMLYLLGMVWVTVRFGRGPGLLASFLSVLTFDFFFVPPALSFTVHDTQYLLTFAIMLTVALTISSLAARLRYQARIATYRERRTNALFDLGKELAGALTTAQIVDIGCRHLRGEFQAQVALLLPDARDEVHTARAGETAGCLREADIGVAQWVYDHAEPAGLGTHTLPANPALYLPLRAPMRTRGVLALAPEEPRLVALPEQYRLLETFAAQIALALERVHYVEVAQDALVAMESERMRNALLATLSHDLRTPLTAIVGLSSAVLTQLEAAPAAQRALAADLHEEAHRMSGMVSNLLHMARLQSGNVQLNRQWQTLEEVVGAALRATSRVLGSRRVEVSLPEDLPLLRFDAVLLERVLVNLFDNAAKYTPPESPIAIGATADGDKVRVWVDDLGPGIPTGKEDRIFERFTRGERDPSRPGTGLGLALCRAIIEAHGGRIWAENRPGGGARFAFTLPLLKPPATPGFPEPEAADAAR
jgi:two-component system, OmpR family, sensor histidine kinase KdpD